MTLFVTGVPAGFYVNGNLHNFPPANASFQAEADTDEVDEVKLRMPPLAGRLITVEGRCKRGDGKPVGAVEVYPSAGQVQTANASSYIHHAQADSAGVFTLDEVPAGRPTRSVRGKQETASSRDPAIAHDLPEQADPGFHPVVTLRPTVKVSEKA